MPSLASVTFDASDFPFQGERDGAPEDDGRFPGHPLSRLRPVLAHLERTLRVAKEVKESPPYVFTG